MALPGMQLPHGAYAKALLQPVDQPRQLLGRDVGFADGKSVLALSQALGNQHVHGRRLEAEVGFELAPETMETQADQLGDMPGIPARCRQLQVQRHHLCIVQETRLRHDSEQQQPQQAGADGIALQVAGESLFTATARLPQVELLAPRAAVGKNTVEAIQSGIVFGAAAELEGMVDRMEKELGSATVVATGGLAPIVIAHTGAIDRYEPWLTLEGLRLVYERNASADD